MHSAHPKSVSIGQLPALLQTIKGFAYGRLCSEHTRVCDSNFDWSAWRKIFPWRILPFMPYIWSRYRKHSLSLQIASVASARIFDEMCDLLEREAILLLREKRKWKFVKLKHSHTHTHAHTHTCCMIFLVDPLFLWWQLSLSNFLSNFISNCQS